MSRAVQELGARRDLLIVSMSASTYRTMQGKDHACNAVDVLEFQ